MRDDLGSWAETMADVSKNSWMRCLYSPAILAGLADDGSQTWILEAVKTGKFLVS